MRRGQNAKSLGKREIFHTFFVSKFSLNSPCFSHSLSLSPNVSVPWTTTTTTRAKRNRREIFLFSLCSFQKMPVCASTCVCMQYVWVCFCCVDACGRQRSNTYTHTCMNTRERDVKFISTRAQTHWVINIFVNAHPYACKHTHIHMHTNMYTQMHRCMRFFSAFITPLLAVKLFCKKVYVKRVYMYLCMRAHMCMRIHHSIFTFTFMRLYMRACLSDTAFVLLSLLSAVFLLSYAPQQCEQ